MMKKKSQMEVELFAKLVIFIGAALLIITMWIWIQAMLNSSADHGIERTVCRQSVLLQASTKGTGGGMFDIWGRKKSIFTIDCPRYFITFYDDKVMVREGTDEKDQEYPIVYRDRLVKSFDGLTEDIVHQVIAEEIRLCWYQFHEGKVDLFNKEWSDFLDNEKNCFICDEIRFDTASFETEQEFKGFLDYLKEEEHESIGQSYYDYFADDDHICSDLYKGDPNCFEAYAEGGVRFLGSKWELVMAYLTWDPVKIHNSKFQIRREIPLNINFTTGTTYSIFFVKQGLDAQEYSTYFAYVLPSDKLQEQCNQFIA